MLHIQLPTVLLNHKRLAPRAPFVGGNHRRDPHGISVARPAPVERTTPRQIVLHRHVILAPHEEQPFIGQAGRSVADLDADGRRSICTSAVPNLGFKVGMAVAGWSAPSDTFHSPDASAPPATCLKNSRRLLHKPTRLNADIFWAACSVMFRRLQPLNFCRRAWMAR